jgi:predicted transcriptional regulator YdeE
MPETRRAQSKRVVGISTRTSNAAEMNPSHAQIPRLWARFGSQDWPTMLARMGASGPVHAVYCDYESDVSGPYRLLLGRELGEAVQPLPAAEVVSVPEGTYLVFPCAGPMPGAVIDGWRRVWQFFTEPDAPRRAYTADFELYSSDHAAPEIWIAVLRG